MAARKTIPAVMTRCSESLATATADHERSAAPGDVVDAALIDRVVRSFYAMVQLDPILSPIFASRITDWEPHMARMCNFWSSVVLGTGRYCGQPMLLHRSLEIDAEHFDRWLVLFKQAVADVCSPDTVVRFVEPATRIARSLEIGVANSSGIVIGRDQRFIAPKRVGN